MPDERGSEYSPTFVYRRKEKIKKPNGSTVEIIPPKPFATDLHIIFKEGGVSVKDTGNAGRAEPMTTKGNEAHFTFPPHKKIVAADGVDPAPEPNEGDDEPQAPPAPPESSCTPTFRFGKERFPEILEWWWTHTKWSKRLKTWVNYDGPHHQGNPTGWECE